MTFATELGDFQRYVVPQYKEGHAQGSIMKKKSDLCQADINHNLFGLHTVTGVGFYHYYAIKTSLFQIAVWPQNCTKPGENPY